MSTSDSAGNSKDWKDALSGPLADFAEDMEPRLAKFEEELARTRLWVVVLGPGKDGEGYQKRLDIQDHLNELKGVRAYFPEDPELKDYVRKRFGLSDDSVIPIEIVQCASADVVLALETTEGPREEVAIFSRRDDIWPKLFPLVHERHKGKEHSTLPGHVRKRLQVQHYSDEDMNKCHLASRICPEVVRRRQIERSRLLSGPQ